MLSFTNFEIVILVLFLPFVLLYYVCISKYREFKKTGIKHLEPLPIFGNLFWSVIGRENLTFVIKRIYDAFPNERYVAMLEFLNPTILVKDPELIKKITIKDFDQFHDLPFQVDENVDPIFGNILMALKGSKWRQTRSAISPAFTSSKIKNMFGFMTDCATRGVSFYQQKVEDNPTFEIDVKYLASRYTIDVIASTSFGFDVDSLKEPNNTFFTESLKITTTNIWLMLKFTGFRTFPKLMKALGIRFMPEKTISYFRNLIHYSLKQREESGLHRPDMLHLLLEAKKGSLKHDAEEIGTSQFASTHEFSAKTQGPKSEWTEDQLIAQAITIILAGQHTTSTLFSFLIYELAVNPDVQERLWEEVAAVMEQMDGKLTYIALLQMEYMDMVISECLRKWPPLPFINRLCVQDYNLGSPNEENTYNKHVKKGETIWIPVHSIHMDPFLWSKPEVFDPERFSKDNAPNIKPFSYLPFGSGPRNCIGSRFALLNLKVILFHYLYSFKFQVCSKTVVPIRVATNTLFMEAKDDYWVAMTLRQKSK